MDEYPNESDAWYPEPPIEQVEAEAKQIAKVTTSIGVIQDVLDWFDANANLYSSVDSLGVTVNTPEADAKLAILLSKQMRAAFQSKAVAFRSEFAKYLDEER